MGECGYVAVLARGNVHSVLEFRGATTRTCGNLPVEVIVAFGVILGGSESLIFGAEACPGNDRPGRLWLAR